MDVVGLGGGVKYCSGSAVSSLCIPLWHKLQGGGVFFGVQWSSSHCHGVTLSTSESKYI